MINSKGTRCMQQKESFQKRCLENGIASWQIKIKLYPSTYNEVNSKGIKSFISTCLQDTTEENIGGLLRS